MINACNASLRNDKFLGMAVRTRRQYLSDLAEHSTTGVTIDQANTAGIVGGYYTQLHMCGRLGGWLLVVRGEMSGGRKHKVD